MTLRVVGAGVGRTGTASLKLALERLLAGRCYHMREVFERPDDIPVWRRWTDGDPPPATFLEEYAATVDWPACAFWRQLADEHPSAVILLSVRDPEAWWNSARRTIFESLRSGRAADDPARAAQHAMTTHLLDRTFTPEWGAREASIAAYLRHNSEVRASAPAGRLLEWRTGDGWAPLAEALGVPVPDEPFPHVNTTAEFLSRNLPDR